MGQMSEREREKVCGIDVGERERKGVWDRCRREREKVCGIDVGEREK